MRAGTCSANIWLWLDAGPMLVSNGTVLARHPGVTKCLQERYLTALLTKDCFTEVERGCYQAIYQGSPLNNSEFSNDA